MTESEARQVLLLRAFEAAPGPGQGAASAHWTQQDATWASRATLEAEGEGLAPEQFVARRAAQAMRRLGPREPLVAHSLSTRLWRPFWLVLAVVLGLLVGGLANLVGGTQRINLLAPPVWGVIAWNLLVYAVLLWRGGRDVLSRQRRLPNAWTRWWHDLLGPARDLASKASHRPGHAGADQSSGIDLGVLMQTFGANWTRASTPLTGARVAAVFHLGAAALALGLAGGLYVRGLALDYRVGWESTFLEANTVQGVLSRLLAPATALSGIGVPDVAGIEALRLGPGHAAAVGQAAPWIHLYALMLMLAVVLPRLLLVAWSLLRSVRLARNFPLSLDDPYYQRLFRHQRSEAARVWVLPYAQALSPAALQALPAMFKQWLGESAQLTVAPVLAFGAEDELAAPHLPPAGTTLVVALFDLTATPEAENQGRLLQALVAATPTAGAGAPVVLMVNETVFRQRFGAQAGRLAQRRQAWEVLAAAQGSHAIWVDLESADGTAAEQQLQVALAAPVRRLEVQV
jgi:hypothetical protein